MPAHKGLEFCNQLLGFFVCDKLGRLHGVYEQFQFREFKTPRREAVECVSPGLHGFDFHAEVPKFLKVEIQGLSIGIDAAGGELINNLRHAERVLRIGLFRKQFGEIQELLLLMFPAPLIFCHNQTSR